MAVAAVSRHAGASALNSTATPTPAPPHKGEGSADSAAQRFDFFFGTFAPRRRAYDRPIAIACLRLFTFLPLRPLLSVPRLRLCIARFTFFDAPREYFRTMASPFASEMTRLRNTTERTQVPFR